MSVESQRAALAEAFRTPNPVPMIAAAAGSAAAGAAVGVGKKVAHEGMEVTREVAPVVAEEAMDMARGAVGKVGDFFKGNPEDPDTSKCPTCGGWLSGVISGGFQWAECDDCGGTFYEEEYPLPEIAPNPPKSLEGGKGMTEIVEDKQKNPPADNSTLYAGVTDPTFLPDKKPEVMQNPQPAVESVEKFKADWESAPTPEEKKAIKVQAWRKGGTMSRKAKKAKDKVALAMARELMKFGHDGVFTKRTKPINNPPTEVVMVPPTSTASTPVDIAPIPTPNPATETVGNPTPLPIINPPAEPPKAEAPVEPAKPAEPSKVETPPAEPVKETPPEPKVESPKPEGCQHQFSHLGVGNPRNGGGKPMNIFKCSKCNKTYGKEV